MANFTPEGIIRIGRVPFDNSYKHTMTFADRTAQASFFSSVCTQSLSRDDYTYVRMGNSIKVPFNSESLFTYNYVMYQNANYGNKWFYAFIVGINYINKSTTELVLQLDEMQTWYFDYELTTAWIDREHVNDDTPGINLVPEPSMDIQYIYDDKSVGSKVQHYCDYRWVCLMVNAYPHYNASQDAGSGSDAVSGGIYNRVYNACKFILYDLWSESSRSALVTDMDMFNGVGAADTIADAFMIPNECLNESDIKQFYCKAGSSSSAIRPNVYEMATGTEPVSNSFSIKRITSVDGYVPRNKKLLTYPFSCLEIGDFNGRTSEYRWEYAEDSGGTLLFTYSSPVGSALTTYITPTNYCGIGIADWSHFPMPFTVDISNKLSWVYSAYQNWAAQNGMANQLSVIGSLVGGAIGVVGGIGAATTALGATAGAHFAQSELVTDASKLGGAAASGIGAIGGIAGSLATNDRMSRVPNTAKGTIAGNSKVGSGYAGWYACPKVPNKYCASVIDGFFDMFGYQTDYIKVPNREGRACWNYVKTMNAAFHGNVPADSMAVINSIYDAGVTFWHNADVGDYSQANPIV